jgi:hypothetical protein
VTLALVGADLDELERRIAATDGALGALWWHAARDLGLIADTPATRRRRVTFDLPGAPTSLNLNAIRSSWKGFHAEKSSWQGELMRAMDALSYGPRAVLVRPIPALRPLWVHLVVAYPRPLEQESENRRPVIAKAVGDALTGPRDPDPELDRVLTYQHRAYTGGWLLDDKDRDWVLTMAIDPTPTPAGVYRTRVLLTWDEAPSTCKTT